MSKADLQSEIRSLYRAADHGMGLAQLIDGVCAAVSRHPGAVAGISGRYAIQAVDTAFERAFALENGAFCDLSRDDPVDVTVSGREVDLLSVFRHELTPMAAILRGKLHIKGSRAALMRFAEFL